MRLLTAVTAACALGLAACGNEGPAGGDERPVTVVATTTQAADLASKVGGDRATVRALIPAGADPHGYEVRPSDIEALADADLIVRSGGDLDEWLADAIESAGGDAPVLNLMDHVETREGGHDHGHEEEGAHAEEEGHAEGEGAHAEEEGAHAEEEGAAHGDDVDPHWWHDPRNGVRAAAALREALAAADPEGATHYEEQGRAYEERLEALDAAIAACWEDVPEPRRRLVTTHDSLGYYADRYGLEVVGAVIPSTSSQGQASAGAVDELVRTIRRERVPAIFTETSLNARVERAIADEAGARVGDPLYADSLAHEGEAATYTGALAANTRALVDGLSGGEAGCSLPE